MKCQACPYIHKDRAQLSGRQKGRDNLGYLVSSEGILILVILFYHLGDEVHLVVTSDLHLMISNLLNYEPRNGSIVRQGVEEGEFDVLALLAPFLEATDDVIEPAVLQVHVVPLRDLMVLKLDSELHEETE